jgi:hypothetical protein
LAYIKTCKNIADIMTKQSTWPHFVQHCDYAKGINVVNVVAAAAAEKIGARSASVFKLAGV